MGTATERATALAAALLLAGCAGTVDDINQAVSTRVSETRTAPGRWTLTAGGLLLDDNGIHPRLLYRAAVLARAADYPYFQVVDFHGGALSSGSGATLAIVGTHDPSAGFDCRAPEEFRRLCRTHGSDETLAMLGPKMGYSPERVQIDVNTVRATGGGGGR